MGVQDFITEQLAWLLPSKKGQPCFGFHKNNSGTTWTYTHEPIQWVNTHTKRWGTRQLIWSMWQPKSVKKVLRTENNKINILAEFETSARQLPMKCPVTKKYISGPIGMPCLMWMEEQVGCSGKLLYACLICTFHYRKTNEGKSHSWPIGTGVFLHIYGRMDNQHKSFYKANCKTCPQMINTNLTITDNVFFCFVLHLQ